MQTLIRRHIMVIEDYDHMMTVDENVKWGKCTLDVVLLGVTK